MVLMLFLLVGCSSPTTVIVNNVLPDGAVAPDDASITNGQDAEPSVPDAGLDAVADVAVPLPEASPDAEVALDAPYEAAPIDLDAGPKPDAYDGIHCLTTAFGLVIGCDGYTGPSTSGQIVETAEYTCPADGSGYGTCAHGAECEVVQVVSGTNYYYPGVCQ